MCQVFQTRCLFAAERIRIHLLSATGQFHTEPAEPTGLLSRCPSEAAGRQAVNPPSLGGPQCCQLLFTQNTDVGRCFFQGALKQCLEWPSYYTHRSTPKQLGAELGDRDTLHSSVGEAGREEQFQPLHMSQSKSKQHNHCRKGVKPALFKPS